MDDVLIVKLRESLTSHRPLMELLGNDQGRVLPVIKSGNDEHAKVVYRPLSVEKMDGWQVTKPIHALVGVSAYAKEYGEANRLIIAATDAIHDGFGRVVEVGRNDEYDKDVKNYICERTFEVPTLDLNY